MATTLSATTSKNALYGTPSGVTITPNQVESTPPTWPWWAYVIGILVLLLVILTCVAIGVGIHKFCNQRRTLKEARRLADAEAAEQGQAAGIRGRSANQLSRILHRDPSASRAVTIHPIIEPLAEIWDVDAELSVDGSSWRVNTIQAWISDIPEDAGADMADLETQLLRARQI